MVVGITGGSGSGKTYLIKKLREEFDENELCHLSMDNYYHSIETQVRDQNGVENFDLPEAIDRKKFASDLLDLLAGKDVEISEYHFNHLERETKSITLKSAPIIVVEGIFTFHFSELLNSIDLKIFMESPEYLMVKRRIVRDATERGYDMEDVLYRFEHHVMPAYSKYINPSKEFADLIIPNTGNLDNAVEVIKRFLNSHLE